MGPGAPRIARAALLVALVSLSVRAVWVSFAHVTPISDFSDYERLATNILNKGDWGTAYRTPGYPCFVAAVYAIFGHTPFAVAGVTAGLGALTSGLLVVLAARVVSRPASILAGLLHALSPTALAYTPLLASENLAVPLVVSATLLLALGDDRAGLRGSLIVFATGVACGVLILVRPAGLFFLPAFVLLALYSPALHRWRPLLPLVLLLGAALPVTPWVIRNQRVVGIPVLASNSGANLLMGNNDLNPHGGYFEEALFPVPRTTKLKRDPIYRAAAIDWIRHNPGRFLALCRARACRLLGTTADSWAARFLWPSAENDRLSRAVWLEMGPGDTDAEAAACWRAMRAANERLLSGVRVVVAPLTLLALALSYRRWQNFALIVAPALLYLGAISLTFAQERFRELSDPLLAVPLAALLAAVTFGTNDLGWRWSLRQRLLMGAAGLAAVGVTARAHASGTLEYCYRVPARPAPAAAEGGTGFTQMDLRNPWIIDRIRPRVTRDVRLSGIDDGLLCRVAAGEVDSTGGVRFPAEGAQKFRVEMTLPDPGQTHAVFIQGVDQERRWRWQWAWQFGPACPGTSDRVTYTFVPGQPVGYFEAKTRPDAGDVVELHIFLRLKPGRKASFVLHKVEIGRPRANGDRRGEPIGARADSRHNDRARPGVAADGSSAVDAVKRWCGLADGLRAAGRYPPGCKNA